MSANPLAADLDHVLEHTRELWEELRGERIFITGGTGFFGCWLLESFLWANARLRLGAVVMVLTRDPEAFTARAPHLAGAQGIVLHRGDVKSFGFPDGAFSHTIHAATETTTLAKPLAPHQELDFNLVGARHTLDFASTHKVAKLLFTSSGAVYGRQPPEITHIPEDYAGAPATTDARTAYGQSKRVIEFYCASSAQERDLQTKIARCFAFAGPGLPLGANYAIGNFIRDVLAGGPIRIQGDGTPYRSYLYSADLAIWLWTILFRGPSGRAYNVGSDQGISIHELARRVAEVLSPTVKIQVALNAPHGRMPERYVPSVSRARQELGLEIRVPLDESIRRTSAFHARW